MKYYIVTYILEDLRILEPYELANINCWKVLFYTIGHIAYIMLEWNYYHNQIIIYIWRYNI